MVSTERVSVLEEGERGVPGHSQRFDLSNYRKGSRKQGDIGWGAQFALECGDN